MIQLFGKVKADLESEYGKMRPNEEVKFIGTLHGILEARR